MVKLNTGIIEKVDLENKKITINETDYPIIPDLEELIFNEEYNKKDYLVLIGQKISFETKYGFIIRYEIGEGKIKPKIYGNKLCVGITLMLEALYNSFVFIIFTAGLIFISAAIFSENRMEFSLFYNAFPMLLNSILSFLNISNLFDNTSTLIILLSSLFLINFTYKLVKVIIIYKGVKFDKRYSFIKSIALNKIDFLINM